MIARVMHIARRESTEIARQPILLAVVLTLIVGIALLGGASLFVLDRLSSEQGFADNLELFGPAYGVHGAEGFVAFTRLVVHAVNFLVFTQFVGVSAVLAGHTVLHERETHALPFLLLAPVRRAELVLGKVLGALTIPGAIYAAVVVVLGLFLHTLPITAPVADLIPPSGGWIAAFALTGPLWALVVCTLCSIASALAPDVRTAQQLVWLVVTAVTLTVCYALTILVGAGAGPELALAGVGAIAFALALAVASATLGRDLAR
jgi:ABC-type transport system involved in multi-copper enzyme maturation permease subunit